MSSAPIITRVVFSRTASKQERTVPEHIQESLQDWINSVETEGIRKTRRIHGYHDEPLSGSRIGQRSVRLNRSYRAIYLETIEGLEILVIEVNKHEY